MADIERMRANFPCAALAEGWDEGDQAEIGAEIKTALDAGDLEAIAYWQHELEERADTWREWCARVRSLEVSIKVEGMRMQTE